MDTVAKENLMALAADGDMLLRYGLIFVINTIRYLALNQQMAVNPGQKIL
jgi:hypothetical protein